MAGRPNPGMSRQNEYFVPRDGIDREVITADICRYLGNDALVRPGTYENKETGLPIQGYYINAYRNLTTAMIEDLKEASRQWALERSRVANGAYRHSETHQRQQVGSVGGNAGGAAPAGLADPQFHNPAQTGYDPRVYQQQPGQYHQQQPPFGGQPQYPQGPGGGYYQAPQPTTRSPPQRIDPYTAPAAPQAYPEQPYAAGAHLRSAYGDQQQDRNVNFPRFPPQGSVPTQQPNYGTGVPSQPSGYYTQPQPAHGNYVPQAQVQPQDPFIGRSSTYNDEPGSPTTKTKTKSNRVAGKGQAYGSPDPSATYEDQSGRTVTPTATAAQPPPPSAGQRRDRDSRPDQHRRHKY